MDNYKYAAKNKKRGGIFRKMYDKPGDNYNSRKNRQRIRNIQERDEKKAIRLERRFHDEPLSD